MEMLMPEDEEMEVEAGPVPVEMRQGVHFVDALNDFVQLLNDDLEEAQVGLPIAVELAEPVFAVDQVMDMGHVQPLGEVVAPIAGPAVIDHAVEMVDAALVAVDEPAHEAEVVVRVDVAPAQPAQVVVGPEDPVAIEADAAAEQAPAQADDGEEPSCGICYGEISDLLKEAEDAGKGGIGGGLALWVCEQPNCGMRELPQLYVLKVDYSSRLVFCITCALDWANRSIDNRLPTNCSQCTRPTDIDGLRKQAQAYDPAVPDPVHEPPQPIRIPLGMQNYFQEVHLVYAQFRLQPNYAATLGQGAMGRQAWQAFFLHHAFRRLPEMDREHMVHQLAAVAVSPVVMGIYEADVARLRRERRAANDGAAAGHGVGAAAPGPNVANPAQHIPVRPNLPQGFFFAGNPLVANLAARQANGMQAERQALLQQLQNRPLPPGQPEIHPVDLRAVPANPMDDLLIYRLRQQAAQQAVGPAPLGLEAQVQVRYQQRLQQERQRQQLRMNLVGGAVDQPGPMRLEPAEQDNPIPELRPLTRAHLQALQREFYRNQGARPVANLPRRANANAPAIPPRAVLVPVPRVGVVPQVGPGGAGRPEADHVPRAMRVRFNLDNAGPAGPNMAPAPGAPRLRPRNIPEGILRRSNAAPRQ